MITITASCRHPVVSMVLMIFVSVVHFQSCSVGEGSEKNTKQSEADSSVNPVVSEDSIGGTPEEWKPMPDPAESPSPDRQGSSDIDQVVIATPSPSPIAMDQVQEGGVDPIPTPSPTPNPVIRERSFQILEKGFYELKFPTVAEPPFILLEGELFVLDSHSIRDLFKPGNYTVRSVDAETEALLPEITLVTSIPLPIGTVKVELGDVEQYFLEIKKETLVWFDSDIGERPVPNVSGVRRSINLLDQGSYLISIEHSGLSDAQQEVRVIREATDQPGLVLEYNRYFSVPEGYLLKLLTVPESEGNERITTDFSSYTAFEGNLYVQSENGSFSGGIRQESTDLPKQTDILLQRGRRYVIATHVKDATLMSVFEKKRPGGLYFVEHQYVTTPGECLEVEMAYYSPLGEVVDAPVDSFTEFFFFSSSQRFFRDPACTNSYGAFVKPTISAGASAKSIWYKSDFPKDQPLDLDFKRIGIVATIAVDPQED